MKSRFLKLSTLLFLFGLQAPALSAQQQIEDILTSFGNYAEIVAAGEAYFRTKHPGVSLSTLTSGAERDGDYVKFMRWQNFWKDSLNADGTLGDISAFGRNTSSRKGAQSIAQSLYGSVAWTNISYENYITHQIGLGRTTSMGFHPTNPDIFYVGAAIGGIWKTTDGGQSYVPLGDGLPFMAVSSIIVRPDNPDFLYIAVSDHVWYGPPGIGVYKSINGGATWQPTALSFDLADGVRIFWMAPDPGNPNKVFIATSDGLYRTNDAFQTAFKASTVSSFDVKVHPTNSNIVYQGGADGAFYRSVDGGVSFALVKDFGNGNVYVATTEQDPSRVYARNGTTLHKSTDSGASFSASTNTFPEDNSVLAFAPNDTDILLVGNFETQRSDDGGASFYATSRWLGQDSLPLIHVDQRNIFTNPLEPDYVYYTNDGGVYRYVISTDTFENLSDGLMITQFYDIAVAQTDQNVIGGGSQDNGNVFRESNGVWDDYAPTGDGMNQEIDPTDANTRYWAYQNGSLHRWTSGVDAHISPPGQSDNGAWETPYRLDPGNPSRLIAGYSTVWQSLNKGASWSDIGGGTSFGGLLEEIAIAKSNSNRIYAARAHQLFVKNVGDNQWATRTMPGTISDLEVDPSDMDTIYITIPGFISGSKVFKSVNAGSNWVNISGSLPNVSTGAIEIYENAPGGLFVGTDAGVYYRDLILPDWQLYGDLPNTRVEDIEIQYASELIRIGTHGRGVLEAPIVIETCGFGEPDSDNDGVCDSYDACAWLDNNLIGTSCDDNDPSTSGEIYTSDCICGGGAPNASYCAAAGSPGTGGDWIERVNLNTLNHVSGFSAYSDFRNQDTTLGAQGAYELTVELFQSFPLDKVYAWVDTNRNGVFAESERVAMSTLDGNQQSVGTVNVPADIGLSPTVMRVRSIYADPNNPNACGNYFGEVEDYTLRFAHCEARGAFGTSADWIKNVRLESIDHDSVQAYYSDFKHLSADLARGSAYPVEVTLNYAFADDRAFAWVDFDQDGQFEDQELTSLSAFQTGFDSVAQGMINVPDGAVPGKTVLRIRSQYGGEDSACGAVFAGEVEDYEINIGYCAARGAPGTGGDYINRVTFNTINNPSGKSGYSDFKNLSTDLSRGASYPIAVQLQYAFDIDHVDVWIDFDKDGQFEEAERTNMSDPEPLIFNGVTTGTVNVPASAIQGETVMRVRTIYSAENVVDSCGSYFGEVEDYTVNLGYCAASGAPGTSDDWISNVKLNTIDHSSGKTDYSQFKDISTTLYRNGSFELETTIKYAFDLDEVYAWIDYNQDGSFTAGERISMSALSLGPNGTSRGTFAVPPDALLGETTMRVRVLYADPNPANPCGSYYGEVEDYTIMLEAEAPPEVILMDGFEAALE